MKAILLMQYVHNYIVIIVLRFINIRYVKLLRPNMNSFPKSFINFALALQGMYYVQTMNCRKILASMYSCEF